MVETSDAGIITVITTDVTDLKDAAEKTFQLTPLNVAGGNPMAIGDLSSTVNSWKCGSGGTAAIDVKYLPDSCCG